MARPSKGDRVKVSFRIDTALLGELVLLRPELLESSGTTRYGGIQSYLTSLIIKDMEAIKTELTPRRGR